MKARVFKKVIITGLITLGALTTFSGCARMENQIAKDGSFFGTTKGNYIIINTSGDKVMDIYKLENAFVDGEEGSDGWNFIDEKGNVVMLGGDVKVIRINDKNTWDMYTEYHYEEEFINELKGAN